jgi:hypothetical protein
MRRRVVEHGVDREKAVRSSMRTVGGMSMISPRCMPRGGAA